MGHRPGDSSTYLRYYTTAFIEADTQSIVFGGDPQTDFVRLMGRLHRHRDAPTKLNDKQRSEINHEPQLLRLVEKRQRAHAEIRSLGYSSAKAAEQTPAGRRYSRCQRQIHGLKTKLTNRRLELVIQEFHDKVHGEEVERQKRGIQPINVPAPSKIEYDLPERAEVASLFTKSADVSCEEELLKLRMELTNAMAQLCSRRESPCRRQDGHHNKAKTTAGPKLVGQRLKAETSLLTRQSHARCSEEQHCCPFCGADVAVGDSQKRKTWRLDSLTRHVRNIHLRSKLMPVDCPHDDCSAVLAHVEHFANHMERQHGFSFPPSILSKSSAARSNRDM